MTIAAWARWDGGNGFEQRVLERSRVGSGTDPLFALKVASATSRVMGEVSMGSALPVSFTSTATVPTNDSLANSGPINWAGVTNGLGIGNQVERHRPFNGWLDEVLLYGRALTADEVRMIYLCGS